MINDDNNRFTAFVASIAVGSAVGILGSHVYDLIKSSASSKTLTTQPLKSILENSVAFVALSSGIAGIVTYRNLVIDNKNTPISK